MVLASAACSRALPDDDTGKNKSGSADRQAATDRQFSSAINMAMPSVVISAGQSGKIAEPLVWLAESTPGSTWQSGGYYAKNKPAATNARADDMRLARQLWDRSAAMLKLQV